MVIVIAVGAILVGPKFFAKKEVKPSTLTKVSMVLDWLPSAQQAGFWIAKDKGYFVKEGLDVDMHIPSDPTAVLQTVATGRDDFGISYTPEVLEAREKGIRVVSIMATVQHPLTSVISLKTSGIKQPKELAGKKVGQPGIAWQEQILNSMLKRIKISR